MMRLPSHSSRQKSLTSTIRSVMRHVFLKSTTIVTRFLMMETPVRKKVSFVKLSVRLRTLSREVKACES